MHIARLSGPALLLSLAAMLLVAPSAQTHTGNENSQGCHKDHKTGEYHCHTPKTPPEEPVKLTYCHVARGMESCGHDRNACYQLISLHGGACEPKLSFRAR